MKEKNCPPFRRQRGLAQHLPKEHVPQIPYPMLYSLDLVQKLKGHRIVLGNLLCTFCPLTLRH